MFKKLRILTLSAILTSIILASNMILVGCSKKEDVVVETMNGKKIVLVLDEGGIHDKSFNESSYNGAKNAEKKYGVSVSYIESKQEADYMQNLESAVDMEPDLIIGVGFKLADAIYEAALAYPDQKFAIVDGVYDDIPDNVSCLLFNEEQSGFTTGLIAAKMTNTNKIGAVLGVDIPSCTNFAVGMENAIKSEYTNVTFTTQFANSFTDAAKCKAIAQQMIADDIDIIFTAAGAGNSGVIEAATEAGIHVIGVDMESNYIAPDTIITSALKRVDVGVEEVIKDVVNNTFEGGIKMFDLSNNGVGYENTKHISGSLKKYVDRKIEDMLR